METFIERRKSSKERRIGYEKMAQILDIHLSDDEDMIRLQNDLITYGIIIANLKGEIRQLREDNNKFKGALNAIQDNYLPKLQEELLGAYGCLIKHLEETSEMLETIKANNGTIGINYMLNQNVAIRLGLETLMNLISKTTLHEHFEGISPV